MSHSSCSAYSWCKYTTYYSHPETGHHQRCSCGYRFSCGTKSNEYCDTPYTCTQCCLKAKHKTTMCRSCKRDVPVSCRGICFEIQNGICRDCMRCSECNIPYYKTKTGYEERDSICSDCWRQAERQVACSRRKCKRYVTINTHVDNPDDEQWCGHSRCKRK